MADAPIIDASDLVGLAEDALRARIGPPATRRAAAADTWLVYERTGLRLRLRLAAPGADPEGASPVVASWTATFDQGHATLAAAAAVLGLWPHAAPDARAVEIGRPLLRRALPAADGRTHSLTATVRGGRVTHLSVFDEPPDWL